MPENTDKEKLRKPSLRITKILANNIKAFRRNNDLSQETLAEMCKLHRTYIGSVERGERNITLSSLEVIAETLGVSIPELLTEGTIRHVVK